MASSAAWQSALTFSDRLAATVKITSCYKKAYPDATPADASKAARALEDDAFGAASSFGDYENRCEAAMQELSPNAQGKEESLFLEQDDDTCSDTGVQMGKYSNAVHYRSGIFSDVYKARRPDVDARSGLKKLVALKVTAPSMMTAPHDSEREARILQVARSEEHRVVPLLETFPQAGGRFVLAFEFMPHDLERLLGQRHLTRIQAKGCLRDIFNALEHLHSLGIIHRDVKPSNVLLRSLSGPAFLADFGIAWKDGDKGSEPANQKITDVGTTHYRAPEVLFGNTSYGPPLDLWAAGCVVAEVACLKGQSLFDSGELGSDLALIQSHFKSLGTPSLDVWPEANDFRDWGKMQFHEYPPKPWTELLPHADEKARDLVSRLVRYESSQRLTASEALQHEYFLEGP